MEFGKELLKNTAIEGSTEVVQEALGILAEQTAGAKGDFFSPKNVDRLIESGLSGAIGGTAFGAPGAYSEATRTKQAAVKEIEAREARDTAQNAPPPLATDIPQGPEPYESTTQGPKGTMYQPSLFGIDSDAPRTPPPPTASADEEALSPAQAWAAANREVQNLSDLLEQQRDLAAKAATPKETLDIREKTRPIETALAQAQKTLSEMPKPKDPDAVFKAFNRATKAWEAAKETGDFAAQERHAKKIVALEEEFGPIWEQLKFAKKDYVPAGGKVESDTEFLQRVPLIAEGREAALEERRKGETALQTEAAALRRMAERTKEGPSPLQTALEERRKNEPEYAVLRDMEKGRLETGFTDQGELFPITPTPETALTPQSVVAEVSALQRMGRAARRARGEAVEEPATQTVTPADTSFTRTFTSDKTTPEITRALITKAKGSELAPEDAAVLDRVIAKYPVLVRVSTQEGAVARPLEAVSDWLYNTLTNVGSLESRQERRQEVEALLSQYDRAAQSETQTMLEPKYRAVTKEEAQALKDTSLAGKRTTVEMAPSPGEPPQTAAQLALPLKNADLTDAGTAKAFATPERFQKYMATDALREARVNAGLTQDTVQFMARLIAPIEKRVRDLQAPLQILLYGKSQAGAKGAANVAGATANKEKAKQKFDAVNTELAKELATFDTSIADAKAKLDNAQAQSLSVLRGIKTNQSALETRIQKFEKTNPEMAAAARAANTRADSALDALLATRENQNSPVAERQRNVQEAVAAQRELAQAVARFENEGGRGAATPFMDSSVFERFLLEDARLDTERRAAAARLGGFTTALNRAKLSKINAERAQETDPARMAVLDDAADQLQQATEKEALAKKQKQEEEASYEPAIANLKGAVTDRAKTARAVQEEIKARGRPAVKGLLGQIEEDTARGVPLAILSKEKDTEAPAKPTGAATPREASAASVARKEDQSRAEMLQRVRSGDVLTPSGKPVPRIAVSPQVLELEKKLKKNEEKITDLQTSKKKEPDVIKKEVADLEKKVRALKAQIKKAGGAVRVALPTQAQLRAERRGQELAGRDEVEVTAEVAEIAKTQTQSRTGQAVRPSAIPPAQFRAGTAESKAGANRGGGKSTRTKDERNLKQRDVPITKEEQAAANKEAARMIAANRKMAKDMEEALAAEKTGDRANEDDYLREDNAAYASRDTHALPQAAYDAVEKGDVDAALASLEKSGSTPFIRELAASIRALAGDVKIEVKDSVEHEGAAATGIYNGKTNTVTLSREIGMTEEDLLHELVHAVTLAALDWKPAGSQMSRRQFLQGAAATIGALKLPNISTDLTLKAQENLLFDMLDSWYNWFDVVSKALPASIRNSPNFDSFGFLSESAYGLDKRLGNFIYEREYADDALDVADLLKDGGLKKLETALQNARGSVVQFVKEKTQLTDAKAKETKPAFELNKAQQQARADLEKLLEQVQQDKTLKEEYGAKDIKEFVAELLSNQSLRDRLDARGGMLRTFIDAIMRLITGKTLSERAVENAMQLFQPANELVNSKTVASVMRGVFPATRPEANSTVDKAVVEMVSRFFKKEASAGDKVSSFVAGLRWRTAIADRWAPIEALLKMGVGKGVGEGEANKKITETRALQTRINMRLHEQVNQYVSTAAIDGVPQVTVQPDGTKLVEGRAGANLRAVSEALSKAKVGNESFTQQLFQTWLMVLRAERDGVGYEKMNFDKPPTAEQAAGIKATVSADPATKAAFEKARALYAQYNKDLMSFLVDAGAIEQKKAAELVAGDYVPFYREMGDDIQLMLGTSKPVTIGSVTTQPYLKELVGGNTSVLPFFSGAMQNTAFLMRMGLRNMQSKDVANVLQDLGLATVIKGDGPANVLRFKNKGENFYAAFDPAAFPEDVPAELVMQGLQGIKTATPFLVKAMAIPANLLRKTITRMPLYAVRQVTRDSTHAWLTTGGDFSPVMSSLKQLPSMFRKENQTELTLERAGVISSNVFTGDKQDNARLVRDISAGKSGWPAVAAKLDEIAIKADSSTRAVTYDAFRRGGMSHAEALLSTLETMNFSRKGTSASMHWLSTMIPFFHSQIQGLDATYRSLKGDMPFAEKMDIRSSLIKRGALMSAMTVGYVMMMQDDEAYKNASDEERAANWFIRIPGISEAVRVPIPFELGILFKVIPELFINTAFGDETLDNAAKTLLKQVWMSNPLRPANLPTALKGPIELVVNYNFFSEAPIESSREKAQTSDQRYRASTTEVAKFLGKAGLLSPLQIDHLVRSYTSSMGIALLASADFALRPLNSSDSQEPPSRRLSQLPVIGGLFQPNTGRGIVNAAFEDIEKFQQASNTYKALLDKGQINDAESFANRFSREIALNSTGGTFRQKMGELAKQKRQIIASPSMDGDQKREMIDGIERIEVEMAKRIRQQATQSE
jgi:hypothetical protein